MMGESSNFKEDSLLVKVSVSSVMNYTLLFAFRLEEERFFKQFHLHPYDVFFHERDSTARFLPVIIFRGKSETLSYQSNIFSTAVVSISSCFSN